MTILRTAVGLAGIDKCVSPHTLRHTAGYLGMSLDVLLNVYGHHRPDYRSDALNKITSREAKAERSKMYLAQWKIAGRAPLTTH